MSQPNVSSLRGPWRPSNGIALGVLYIAIIAGLRLLPELRDQVARRLDWTGAALSGAGLD